ncbi:hypothetical protein [Streptomyces sp. NPDC057910]|uniref:hypothetical protein n=1 Tax=Streptomyces sp. NPDC057910 TaxID=3346278 RepID=UPI0036E5725A
MSEMEDLEFYGGAVKVGEMSLAAAAAGLAAAGGGRITAIGAEYLISAWIPARREYEARVMQALLNAFGVEDPLPNTGASTCAA